MNAIPSPLTVMFLSVFLSSHIILSLFVFFAVTVVVYFSSSWIWLKESLFNNSSNCNHLYANNALKYALFIPRINWIKCAYRKRKNNKKKFLWELIFSLKWIDFILFHFISLPSLHTIWTSFNCQFHSQITCDLRCEMIAWCEITIVSIFGTHLPQQFHISILLWHEKCFWIERNGRNELLILHVYIYLLPRERI